MSTAPESPLVYLVFVHHLGAFYSCKVLYKCYVFTFSFINALLIHPFVSIYLLRQLLPLGVLQRREGGSPSRT